MQMLSCYVIFALAGMSCADASPSQDMLSPASEALVPAHAQAQSPNTRFAVIGDYGIDSEGERDVAALVHKLAPHFVMTTGDNNYPKGEAHLLDINIGQYYHDFIFPYRGRFGTHPGAQAVHPTRQNRFWPALGNHDWEAGDLTAYFDYFKLPGQRRYYDVVQGPVHLFALDTDPREPDGITADSRQGQWLQQALAQSRAPWKVVYMHHPPFGSSNKPLPQAVDWPFKAWGASIVICGHKHYYERLEHAGLTYVINGLGGAEFSNFGEVHPESIVRFNADFGAMIAEATPSSLVFEFITRQGNVVDKFSL